MAKQAASIHIKRTRGKVYVMKMGQTPRGQRFLSATRVLECPSIGDPAFKKELAKAVMELAPEKAPAE